MKLHCTMHNHNQPKLETGPVLERWVTECSDHNEIQCDVSALCQLTKLMSALSQLTKLMSDLSQ